MKKQELRVSADQDTVSSKPTAENLKFTVILVEPEGSANIGAICRSMKNFDLFDLMLFNPKCEIDSDARKYAMHAREDVLFNAKMISIPDNSDDGHRLAKLKSVLKGFDYVIGTSAKPSMFRNIRRIYYYVDELDLDQITNMNEADIALVFGREPTGLYNDELDLCDFILRIPASDDYPSLNLAHAATIIFFTLFKKRKVITKGTIHVSNRNQREVLIDKLQEVLDIIELERDVDEKVIRAYKNILGRSFSSMKEVNLLITLFNKIGVKFELMDKTENGEE
mgnify:CR=1 FL=1